MRKYATPTHSSAFRGLPSITWPRWSSTPYAPHDSTAPSTKTSHRILDLCCSLFVRDREQLIAIVEEDRSAGGGHGRVDGAAHVHFGKHFLLAPVREHGDVPVFVADVHLAVG